MSPQLELYPVHTLPMSPGEQTHLAVELLIRQLLACYLRIHH